MSSLVLIVEDDPDIRESLELALQVHGYQVIAARHGRDALDRTIARGQRPAIILLDLQMPVMDGEEFLATQPEVSLLADVPVVVMTAQLRQEEALPTVVRAILRKPVGLPVLLELIRREGTGVPPLPLAMLAGGTGRLPERRVAPPREIDEHTDPGDAGPGYS